MYEERYFADHPLMGMYRKELNKNKDAEELRSTRETALKKAFEAFILEYEAKYQKNQDEKCTQNVSERMSIFMSFIATIVRRDYILAVSDLRETISSRTGNSSCFLETRDSYHKIVPYRSMLIELAGDLFLHGKTLSEVVSGLEAESATDVAFALEELAVSDGKETTEFAIYFFAKSGMPKMAHYRKLEGLRFFTLPSNQLFLMGNQNILDRLQNPMLPIRYADDQEYLKNLFQTARFLSDYSAAVRTIGRQDKIWKLSRTGKIESFED